MFKIKIKKGPRALIFLTIYLTFSIGLLESFGAPHVITYIFDVITIIMLMYLIGRKGALNNKTVFLQVLLFLFGTFVAIANSVSPFLIIWSLRNNIKFIIFFDLCLIYLNKQDIDELYDIFYKVEFINFFLVFFEFFILGFNRDNLGGIFGTTNGVNGILNCFLVLQLVKHFVCWMQKKEKVLPLILSIGMSLLISAISEIKIYFIELAIVFILYFVWIMLIEHNYRPLIKYSIIGIIAVLGAHFAIQNLVKIYPEMSGFFSLEKILYHATKAEGYTGHGDLNRLSAISTINKSIFSGSKIKKIVGLGLGATEFAEGKELLTSEFYNKYQFLHYTYFSLPWLYLETGVIGLMLYILSFFVIILDCLKNRHDNKNIAVVSNTFLVSVMTFLFLIYNQSMRQSAAYLVYAYFAIMYIVLDSKEQSGNLITQKCDETLEI